jgi:hypothetical protein
MIRDGNGFALCTSDSKYLNSLYIFSSKIHSEIIFFLKYKIKIQFFLKKNTSPSIYKL